MAGLRLGHGASAGLVSGSPRFLGGGWSGWPNYSGDQWRADLSKPVEGVGELIPGPTMVDSGSSLPANEAGGDVQQPVVQHLGLGLGQVVGQQGGLSTSDQVGRGQRELQPGLVDRQVV